MLQSSASHNSDYERAHIKNRPTQSYLSKYEESTDIVNSFSAAPSNPRMYMKIIKESPRLKQRRMDLKD